MDVTDEDLTLIRRSFSRLREASISGDPFGTIFYGCLFAHLPKARALFREDMTEQGMRFLSTLAFIVDHMDRPLPLEEHLTRLARGHAAYGVTPDYYPPMGLALRETMAQVLSERYDAATDAAWARAYDGIALQMSVAAAMHDQV